MRLLWKHVLSGSLKRSHNLLCQNFLESWCSFIPLRKTCENPVHIRLPKFLHVPPPDKYETLGNIPTQCACAYSCKWDLCKTRVSFFRSSQKKKGKVYFCSLYRFPFLWKWNHFKILSTLGPSNLLMFSLPIWRNWEKSGIMFCFCVQTDYNFPQYSTEAEFESRPWQKLTIAPELKEMLYQEAGKFEEQRKRLV